MINKSPNETIYDTTFRMLIVLLIVAWCLLLMYPFVSIILWSFILAMALLPLHKRLSKKLGGRPKLTSFIIVTSLLMVIILPASLLVWNLVDEVKALKVSYEAGTLTIPPPTEKVKDWPIVGQKLYDTWQSASGNLLNFIIKNKDKVIGIGKSVASSIVGAIGGLAQIMVSLVIAGILLVIGGLEKDIRKFFRKVGGERGDEFADLTLATIGSVVKGIIGEALIIAILNGLVFLVAGVPYVGIWTVIVFVLALVQMPVLLVTVPIMIWFFATKSTFPAVAYTVILLLVSFSDNIITPIMLGKGAPVPTLVIFIGAIGGLILSGFIGLFTGAIVMSLGYKLYLGWITPAEVNVAE
jgi:predicted PurR-regulated permease PerM